MARKPQSFKLNEAKKIIILYTNIRIDAENDLINFYLDRGYAPMYEEKKPSVKVADMRKDLKADKEALDKFNAIYGGTYEGDDADAGFFGACKYYNEWKKNKAKKKDEAKAEATA